MWRCTGPCPRTRFFSRAACRRLVTAHGRFSARVVDAAGSICARSLKREFEQHGAVYVVNSGLAASPSESFRLPEDLLKTLGFSDVFSEGGQTSEAWQHKHICEGFRRMDFYPPERYLLPNQEVQYMRRWPARLLFFCNHMPAEGGRVFLHSAKEVETLLSSSALGRRLLEKLCEHGMTLEFGYLDKNNPEKATNYYKSWQELTGCEERTDAEKSLRGMVERFDECWWRDDTLMTRFWFPAFKLDPRDGQRYLRFPRVAADGPCLKNGYRQFLLGDGSPLSVEENELLVQAYLQTRTGVRLKPGEFALVDNIRFAHSREPFTGHREFFLGMAGSVTNDVHALSPAMLPSSFPLNKSTSTWLAPPVSSLSSHASLSSSRLRYSFPTSDHAQKESFSMRIFDAEQNLSASVEEALCEYRRFGALHIVNTGFEEVTGEGKRNLQEVLAALGFGPERLFSFGGLTSGRTHRQPLEISPLRSVDLYPPQHFLLPHNEILYQRRLPLHLLFYCIQPSEYGGRTFVHCARTVETMLRSVPLGNDLVERLKRFGLTIEQGFLDEKHECVVNGTFYFRSWQERFRTNDPEVAMRVARGPESRGQFDCAWWRREADGSSTLMTRVTVAGFNQAAGVIMFPRIAMDGPEVFNGHRVFSLGDGKEVTPEETELLLDIYMKTRQGVFWKKGDILLCNNLLFGHSRESFPAQDQRKIGVALADGFDSDPLPPIAGEERHQNKHEFFDKLFDDNVINSNNNSNSNNNKRPLTSPCDSFSTFSQRQKLPSSPLFHMPRRFLSHSSSSSSPSAPSVLASVASSSSASDSDLCTLIQHCSLHSYGGGVKVPASQLSPPLLEALRTAKWDAFRFASERARTPTFQPNLLFDKYRIAQGVSFTPYAISTRCPAHCHYCSEDLQRLEEERPNSSSRHILKQENYERYYEWLKSYCEEFSRRGFRIGLSMSGLEPTSDAVWMRKVIDIVNSFPAVFGERVLYTNGFGLARDPGLCDGFDRVEWHRDHYDEEVNQSVMRFERKAKDIQSNAGFEKTVRTVQTVGGVKNQNLVIVCLLSQPSTPSLREVRLHAKWARDLGFKGIIFREISRINPLEYLPGNYAANWMQQNRVSIDTLFPDPSIPLRHATVGYYYYNESYDGEVFINPSTAASDAPPFTVTLECNSHKKFFEVTRNGYDVHKLVLHSNGSLASGWNRFMDTLQSAPN